MTYESRTNGTHALRCDTGPCRFELIGPERDDLFADAITDGWVDLGGKHYCPNCQRGVCAATHRLEALFGSDSPIIDAPVDVKAGDPVLDGEGLQVAVYVHDAAAGQPVQLTANVAVPVQATVSPQYAAILGRTPPAQRTQDVDTDDLFAGFAENVAGKAPQGPVVDVKLADLFGPGPHRRQPGKPVQAPAKDRPYGLTTPPGATGGRGLVVSPDRPDPKQVAAVTQGAKAKPTRPKVSIEVFDDSSAFDFLDEGKARTGWNPDE